MDATPAALQTICRTHAEHGTTGLLATTITQSREAISAALANAARACEVGPDFCPAGAAVLGIHLEGPYISPEKPGAQPKEFVRDYDAEEFAGWVSAAAGTLRLITMAPERPGAADLIAACRESGMVVSLGHTNADAAATTEAVALGARHGTHLFNAMPPIHHRKPGPIPILLCAEGVYGEIIADGHHVAPEVIRMAVRARGESGVILITDAIRGAGLGDGVYDLGGHDATVRNGMATLPDGTLAGSVLTMDRAGAHLREWAGLDWTALALLLSTNAADQMGWPNKGRIQPGSDADLTLVDDAFNVGATFVGGHCVYRRT